MKKELFESSFILHPSLPWRDLQLSVTPSPWHLPAGASYMSPSANLLPCVAEAAADAVKVREMTLSDLEHGVLESLASLAEVGLSAAEAVPIFHERLRAGVRTFVACVGDRVVGTASVLLERKFIHRGGLV